MDAEAIQLMRVAGELLKYFYLEGSRKVRASYEFGPGRWACLLEAEDLVLPAAKLEALRKALSGPRQPEVAEYYGALVGKRLDEVELSLVGAMADIEELVSEPGRGTRLRAVR